MKRIMLAIAVILLIHPASFATEPPEDLNGNQISQERLELAYEMVTQMVPDDNYERLVIMYMRSLQQVIIASTPEKERAIRKILSDIMSDMLLEKEDYLKTISIAYAKVFNERELRDLINFFNTPAGKKWITEQPRLTRMRMEASQAFTEKLIRRLEEKIRKKIQDLEARAFSRPCTPPRRCNR